MNLRRISYRILTGTLRGEMPKKLIEEAYYKHRLSHSHRAFIAEMVYGTLRSVSYTHLTLPTKA